jgi:signal transduction histidine kinase
MRTHWWQSIRWRMAFGSTLIALLATGLLALTALLAIIMYYGVDQTARLDQIAAEDARSISAAYAQYGNLHTALLLSGRAKAVQNSEYYTLIFNSANQLIYPPPTISTRTQIITLLLYALHHPNYQNATVNPLRNAVTLAQADITTPGEIGPSRPVARPFIAMPITSEENGGSVVGVLLMMPKTAAENTVPPFISAVGKAVLIASLGVALIAALVAILFSRTITHPISHLTEAARVLAAGDYNVRVHHTDAQGEIGELAHSFNEMATQLQHDVEELRKQELWRRELIMSITHDLATPLTAIAGLGESLVDGVNQSREDYEETGRVIVRETLRLRRLVRDLHMMAKVEAGALSPMRKPVRLAALVDEVLAVLAPEFERAQVEPNNTIPFNLPAVPADSDMLTRVFSNLCDNALRHTPAGGMVTVAAEQRDDTLLVSVTDTGEGIPPDALQRVFERFFRVDSARRSSTGGSGLGLTIVKAIIEAHGGTIWAENVPGAGARIVFTLPLQPVDHAEIASVKTIPLS